jgi:hypothetical protein
MGSSDKRMNETRPNPPLDIEYAGSYLLGPMGKPKSFLEVLPIICAAPSISCMGGKWYDIM